MNAQNIVPASGAATTSEEPELAFEESIPWTVKILWGRK